MRHLVLIALAFISTILFTSCGGRTEPVPMKVDTGKGYYVGGYLPGVPEEMMKDPKVSARDIVLNIKKFTGSEEEFKQYKDELKQLSKSRPAYSRDRTKMLDDLNRQVNEGNIVGYTMDENAIVIYSKHGFADYYLLNSSSR